MLQNIKTPSLKLFQQRQTSFGCYVKPVANLPRTPGIARLADPNDPKLIGHARSLQHRVRSTTRLTPPPIEIVREPRLGHGRSLAKAPKVTADISEAEICRNTRIELFV